MKYQIVEEEEIFETIEEAVDYCISEEWHEDDDSFADWVNDNYESVDINGYYYSAYDIISSMNDDNWGDLKDIYCEECNERDREEAIRNLLRASVEDEIEVHGYNIRVIEDNDETEDFDENENDLLKLFQIVSEPNE